MVVYKVVIGDASNSSEKEVFFNSVQSVLMFLQETKKALDKTTVKTNSTDRLQLMDAKMTVPEMLFQIQKLGIYYVEFREHKSRKLKRWYNIYEVPVRVLDQVENEETEGEDKMVDES